MKAQWHGIELKTGMRIEFKNGRIGLIILSDDIISQQPVYGDASKYGMFVTFDDKMMQYASLDPTFRDGGGDWQIVKIFQSAGLVTEMFNKDIVGKVIWERKPGPDISIGDNKVVFQDNGVKVGCTFVSKETVKQIAEFYDKKAEE